MRIAHATDIHWMETPAASQLLSAKRFLGTLNLHLRGRAHHFDRAVQSALVQTIVDQEPDVVLITGDLTAMALPSEFETARRELDPILSRFPTFIIPGNHDVYTGGAARDKRIQELFSTWMGLDEHGLGHLQLPGLTVVGLDPNRPHPVLSSGLVPADQLAALPAALAAAPEDDFLVLALHYPVLSRKGAVYDGFEHGLRNASELIDVLRGSPRKPDIIIHGHKHHGFTVDLDLGDVSVPIHNPGSSGYAHLPKTDRAGCFNIYETEGNTLRSVERFRFLGEGFAPETGGAYASGR